MHEKHLLLPSAKTAVLVVSQPPPVYRYVRWGTLAAGLLCVLVGAADVTTRVAQSVLGDEAGFAAFAPLVARDLAGRSSAQPATSTPGVITPARLSIPMLGISAAVEEVGKKQDGSMGTPKDFGNVGWYSYGKKPGEKGSSVFAGHVNNARTTSGVFEQLSQLPKGAYITVADAAGRTKVYKVSEIRSYALDASSEELFVATGEQLVLITCEGKWLPETRTFDKRLVVIARPV